MQTHHAPATHASPQLAFTDESELADGLLVVECKVGRLTSNSQPVVVTSDLAQAEEICCLLQEGPEHVSTARTAGMFPQ